MNWLEISVTVEAEVAEAVAEVLSRYAPYGVAIEPGDETPTEKATIYVYLPGDEAAVAVKRCQVEEALWHLGQLWPLPAPICKPLEDEDWMAVWQDRVPILRLGERVVIKPSWHRYTPAAGEIVLEMDPGVAFGTGLHPTTQLCVAVLEKLVRPGMRLLDLGTGTGILALVAAQLAPVEILAVDHDADAIAVARRNFRVNHATQGIHLLRGSLADVNSTHDLILANLLSPIIIRMARAGLVERLRRDGFLIASGILVEQVTEVTAALERSGLQVTETRQKGDWVALIAERARKR
ncbi:MAG: 50S ribosomal protein L11 methyltransferase [Chloroflexota bacterium]|nr:50S ribosomal protein L11 methyltransferase [Chloroflexota bacterium]